MSRPGRAAGRFGNSENHQRRELLWWDIDMLEQVEMGTNELTIKMCVDRWIVSLNGWGGGGPV